MAKLIDRLHELGKSNPAPIGFGRPATPKRTPAMLLIAQIAPAEIEKFTISESAKHADALLLAGTPGDKSLNSLKDLLWGVRLEKADEEGLDQLKEAGCDFVQIDSDEVSAIALRDDGMAHGGVLPLDITDRQARVLDDLPFDYLTISYTTLPEKLTLRALSEYQAAVSMVSKHIVLEVENMPSKAEVELLRDLPADALIADASGMTAKQWQEARELIDDLEPRKPRSHGDEPVSAQTGSTVDDSDIHEHDFDDDDEELL